MMTVAPSGDHINLKWLENWKQSHLYKLSWSVTVRDCQQFLIIVVIGQNQLIFVMLELNKYILFDIIHVNENIFLTNELIFY